MRDEYKSLDLIIKKKNPVSGMTFWKVSIRKIIYEWNANLVTIFKAPLNGYILKGTVWICHIPENSEYCEIFLAWLCKTYEKGCSRVPKSSEKYQCNTLLI